MKKVLLVISTLNYGGAQRAFANMSLKLSQTYQIDFLLNDSKDITYEYHGNIIDLGIGTKENRSSIFYQIKVFLKRYEKLRKLKRSGQYVACISALTSANAVNVLTGNKCCKTIISVRSFMSKRLQDVGKLTGMIEYMAVRCTFNNADCVVAVSKSMEQDLVKNFGVRSDKIISLYNGYDLEGMDRLSREVLDNTCDEWFSRGKRIIVTSGRLSEEKGHIHLIRAFAIVKKILPNVRLLILGDGELKEFLQQTVKELGLEEDVILGGFVKNPYKVIRKCDLFVLSSSNEGFPNALAESLCLGVPAVSTDCDSGAREILAPNTDLSKKVYNGFEKAEYGILCPVCQNRIKYVETDPTEEQQYMADAILYMLQNDEVYTYYKERCKKRSEQFSMDQIMKQWIALIEQ